MKKLTNISVKILSVVMLLLLLSLFGCDEKDDQGHSKKIVDDKTKETITSVESMRLSTSSYESGEHVYEIENKNSKTELNYYRVKHMGGGKEELELERSAMCDTQDFIEIMNACNVGEWDGFSEDNYDTYDGTSFTFKATVNGDKTINADGYADFPEGYGKFVSKLETLLDNSEQTKK